jgi:hypothetical protein
MTREDRIRARFVRRAVRLAHYHRWLVAVGLGLTVFTWAATADAWFCKKINGVWRCFP